MIVAMVIVGARIMIDGGNGNEENECCDNDNFNSADVHG